MAIEKQFAALPFRLDKAGRPQVLLITSRDTKRWVVPKGWPMPNMRGHEAAEVEAFEEAGVRGKVDTPAIGTFDYEKRLGGDKAVPCRVEVFPMLVQEELDSWPEMDERERKWFRPKKAARLVEEEDLAKLILSPKSFKMAS